MNQSNKVTLISKQFHALRALVNNLPATDYMVRVLRTKKLINRSSLTLTDHGHEAVTNDVEPRIRYRLSTSSHGGKKIVSLSENPQEM